ncbi:10083_t:CDS:2, partial [Acaulospora colombiana]
PMVSQILQQCVANPHTARLLRPNGVVRFRGTLQTLLRTRYYSIRFSKTKNSLLLSQNHRPSNVYPQLKATSVRSFGISTIPRFILHAMRIPVAGVTVGVGGLTYANYKFNGRYTLIVHKFILSERDFSVQFLIEMANKSSDMLSSLTGGIKSAVDAIGDGLSRIDVELRVPDFLSNLFSSKPSTSSSSSQLQMESDRPRFIKKDEDPNSSDPSGDGGVAAAAAATLFMSGKDDDNEGKPERRHGIPAQDDEFMLLTRKLIEVRNILTGIDHNEGLRLPSIVVIGSQSSGKSSVLEAIVGHEFLPNNKNQPDTLKEKIVELCEQYIREPNIILAVCAADVDLANSEALKSGRKVDPLGLRTIGVITKMDLVEPEYGASILRNTDYPLHLGYIGVVCKPPLKKENQENISAALMQHEDEFFRSNYVYSQRGIQVGTGTLRRKLMEVLEESMAKSLFSIVGAVQLELEEARYQFKVQYNDRRITAESYVAETIDSIKHNFKDFAHSFGKPQVRHEVRTMLEQRVLDLCAELYWTDGKIIDLQKAAADDLYWQYKLEMSSAALTKSGIGRTSTQLVVDVLMANMEKLVSMDPLNNHPDTSSKILKFCNEILRNKFHTTADQWAEGVKRTISLLEKELESCNKALQNIKNSVGKKKLRAVIKYVLDAEKEEAKRQARVRDAIAVDSETAESGSEGTAHANPVMMINNVVEEGDSEHHRVHFNRRVIEKAREAIFLRDRSMILKYRLAAIKSRQCKSSENKQYCPEAFLNMVAEKLTYTAVMFIQVELLNEFFFQFPREVDNRLVYDLDRKQIWSFAKENPNIRKHLELQERKRKLEEVMEKLNYLVRRQRDIESRKGPGSVYA